MIPRSRIPLLFLFGSLFLSVSTLFAQSIRIVGQLRVNDGHVPPHQILVELQLRGDTLSSAYTDGHGRFGFYNLDDNPYHVVINDPAFRRVDELASVSARNGLNIIQITLSPRDDVKQTPAFFPARTSGSNPYLVDPADYYRHVPKKAVNEFDRGVRADWERRHDDAIQHYQKAVKIAPLFYMAHNNLGSDYLRKANFSAAKNEFQQASQLHQIDGGPYFNLSNVCILTGELPQAQLYLNQGMRLQPFSAFGHFLQGTLDIHLGRLPQAESALHRSIRLDPMMSQARLQLVNLLLKQGRKEEAVVQLQDFVAAFPESPFSGKVEDLLKRLEGPAPDSQPVSNSQHLF